MKKLTAFALLSLMGCGGTDPTNTPTPDAGTVAMNDVPSTDRATTDAATPPGDRGATMPDAGQTMACVPHPTDTCRGAALCRPNEDNVLCEGAQACTCAVTERDMPEPCRTGEMMPGCMAQISCAPGRNHCNVDLPRGTDWSPFVSENDFFRSTTLTLTRWRNNEREMIWGEYSWTNGDNALNIDGTMFQRDEHGYRMIVLTSAPRDTRPVLGEESVTLRCAGPACYYRRGLSGLPGNTAWSFELSFEGRCAAYLRVFRPDGTEDMTRRQRFLTTRPSCT